MPQEADLRRDPVPVTRGSLFREKSLPSALKIGGPVILGWTPYFPLLGGVVHEFRGLLSHGAVVAREYGLLAVVGVHGVTEFVKSGDIVTLDGNTGLIHKAKASDEGTEIPSSASVADRNLSLEAVNSEE